MASRELSILVTAKNMASKVLGQVRGDVNKLDRAGRQAGSNLGRNVGIGAGVLAAGLGLQVRAGVDSLVELERVENLTAAAIKSTGNLANQSVEGIRARSEAMENMTGVDDKVLQNAQNLLLTFPQVGEKAFEPTLEAAVNLNAALGGGDEGLQGTLLQVAKAVNDPIRGMTALRRSGVSFTKEQQDQVKEMVAANDMMGAQAIVLGELEKQFGGAAEAANQGAGRAQRRWTDAVEDIQKALATGFLPLIEKASGKIQEMVANPAFMQGVQEFGGAIAGAFDSALDFASSIPWDSVGAALQTAGTGARMAMDAFLSAPAWLQTAILTGWGLNKLTGGALGSLVGMIGQGIIKGVMNMNAGVVNINAATVNGGGGVPGAGGKGGGFMGGLGRGLLTGGVVGGAAVAVGGAAVTVGNFVDMREQAMGGLQDTLDGMPRRTAAEIDASIARIEHQINMERPLLEGVLFNTNVKPQLEREIAELQQVKTHAQRSAAGAWDASSKIVSTQQAIHNLNSSEGARAATQHGLLSSINAKKTSVTAIVNTSVNVNLQQWQRATVSSIRANSNSGGFI